MVALAVVGPAAAGAAYGRSDDDAAGRAGLLLIELTLSGNDGAHFERNYDRLSGDTGARSRRRRKPVERRGVRTGRARLHYNS